MPTTARLSRTLISYRVFASAANDSNPKIVDGIVVEVAVEPDVNIIEYSPVTAGLVIVNDVSVPQL